MKYSMTVLSLATVCFSSAAFAESIAFTSKIRIADKIDTAMGTESFDHIYLQTADRKYTARVTCEGAVVGTPMLKVLISTGDNFEYSGSRTVEIPQASNKQCKQSYLDLQKTQIDAPFVIDLRYSR